MKHRAVFLVLVLSLLSYAAAGFSGCGSKHNALSTIIVTPLDPVIAMGKTLQLSVTAIFSDGLVVTSWSQVTWRSSDTTVATVNSSGGVTAVAEGTAVISATDTFHPDIVRSVIVTVTQLLSITITPTDAVISLGTVSSQTFSATGFYSTATPTTWAPTGTRDLTTLVSWASSSTPVAVISNVTGSNGFATAVSAGTTTITATDLATGITGTATLTVGP
jgi:trimeric autotransporter adhesin